MKKIYTNTILLLTAVFAIFSCTPESAELPPTPIDELVNIRVLNANINHKDISVNVGGYDVHSNLLYGELSAYNKYEPSTLRFSFSNPDSVFFIADIGIEEKADYTLISFTYNDTVQQLLRISDIESSAPNKADIRFLNFKYKSPDYDLRIGGMKGEILLDSIGYSNISSSGTMNFSSYPLDEGNYTFALTKTSDGSLVSEYEPIYLEGGKVYYITCLGEGEQSYTRAFVSNGLTGDYIDLKEPAPKVMCVNMLEPEEQVDIYLNGNKGAMLGYSDNSDYLIGHSNSNTLSVLEYNTTNSIIEADIDLEDQLKKTFIAYRESSGTATYKIFTDDLNVAGNGKTKIRFINMTDLAGLNLTSNAEYIVANLGSREASDYVEVIPDNFKLEILNSSGEALSAIREIELPANKIITFIAYKLAAPNGEFEYALKRIDY